MSKALGIHQAGGPETFRWEDVDVGQPGPGQVRLRHTAVGFNSLDVDQRSGAITPKALPLVVGIEGAGIVAAIGPEVTGIRPGDRVAYPFAFGAYAEERLIDAQRLVALPADITDRQAAAALTKGLTTYQLFRRAYPVRAGDTLLFHAAAGGVGLIACQWARHLGACLIGTVSSREKAAAILRHGAATAIVRGEEDVIARVKEITAGAGANAVFDGVGQETIAASLKCVATYGTIVRFGDISGDATTASSQIPVSTWFTKASLITLINRPSDYRTAVDELFALIRQGALRFDEVTTFPLRQAAEAHRLLEARRNVGPIVVLP